MAIRGVSPAYHVPIWLLLLLDDYASETLRIGLKLIISGRYSAN